MKEVWSKIPNDADILLTHGPPLGFGDRLNNGEKVGCADLLEAVKERRESLKVHLFGHVVCFFSLQSAKQISEL